MVVEQNLDGPQEVSYLNLNDTNAKTDQQALRVYEYGRMFRLFRTALNVESFLLLAIFLEVYNLLS